ncbi:hypothetical protein D3C80_2125650 [compost metagenome]
MIAGVADALVAADTQFHRAAAPSAEAVVGIPVRKADGLGYLAQQFLIEKMIAIKGAGIGQLIVAR